MFGRSVDVGFILWRYCALIRYDETFETIGCISGEATQRSSSVSQNSYRKRLIKFYWVGKYFPQAYIVIDSGSNMVKAFQAAQGYYIPQMKWKPQKMTVQNPK